MSVFKEFTERPRWGLGLDQESGNLRSSLLASPVLATLGRFLCSSRLHL